MTWMEDCESRRGFLTPWYYDWILLLSQIPCLAQSHMLTGLLEWDCPFWKMPSKRLDKWLLPCFPTQDLPRAKLRRMECTDYISVLCFPVPTSLQPESRRWCGTKRSIECPGLCTRAHPLALYFCISVDALCELHFSVEHPGSHGPCQVTDNPSYLKS